MMDSQLRTAFPTMGKNLTPKWPDFKQVCEADKQVKAAYRFHFNRRNSSQETKWLWNWMENKGGKAVVGNCETPRSYIVRTGIGVLWRNRRHLKFLLKKNNSDTNVPDNTTNYAKQEDETESHAIENLPDVSDCTEVPVTDSPQVIKTSSERIVKRPVHYRDWLLARYT